MLGRYQLINNDFFSWLSVNGLFSWIHLNGIGDSLHSKFKDLPNFLLSLSMEQMFVLLPCYLYTEDNYLLDRNRYIPQKSAGVDCIRFDLQLSQAVCFEWVSIPRLPRRLGNHERWPQLIAVTPVDQWRPPRQLCQLSSLFLHEAVQKFVYGRCRSCSPECHCPG